MGIKVSMSGRTAKVERTHVLKAIGGMKPDPLMKTYHVTLGLGDLDLKSPAAKAVLKEFPSRYQKRLAAEDKRRAAANDKIWAAAASVMQSPAAEKQVRNAEQVLDKRWADFEERFIRKLAPEVSMEIAAEQLSKEEAKHFKSKFKLTWGTKKELFASFGIFTGLLDVKSSAALAGGALAAGGLAALAPVGVTLLAIGGALAATRKFTEASSLNVKTAKKHVSKNLSTIASTMRDLEKQVQVLEGERKRAGLEAIALQGSLKGLQQEQKRLKQLPLKNAKLEGLRKESDESVAKTKDSLAAMQSQWKQLDGVVTSVRALTKSANEASNSFDVAMSNYDKEIQKADELKEVIKLLTKIAAAIEKANKS